MKSQNILPSNCKRDASGQVYREVPHQISPLGQVDCRRTRRCCGRMFTEKSGLSRPPALTSSPREAGSSLHRHPGSQSWASGSQTRAEAASPEGLLRHWCLGPPPGVGRGPQICIDSKSPGDAEAAGQRPQF